MAAGEHDLEFRPVKGIDGLNAELEPASARGQVVMFDFYADRHTVPAGTGWPGG